MSDKIAEKIRCLRRDKGLTLQQVADKVGISHSSIWNIENGVCRNVSMQRLMKIADALGVKVEAILGDSMEVSKKEFDIKFNKLSYDDQRRIMMMVNSLF